MRLTSIFLVVAVLAMAPNSAFGEHVIDSSKDVQYLYVMSAESGSFDGEKLTLNGVPNVIYFSDRPNRIAGHISLKEFVETWGKGSDSFKADPPNATLSIFDESGSKDVVIELKEAELKGDLLKFEIRIIQGELPKDLDVSSLFVDVVSIGLCWPN